MRASIGTTRSERGFSLVELMISTLVVLTISAAVFNLLAETQRSASYQAEMHGVTDNTRIAMETIERYIRQAGNDPLNAGFAGVTVISATSVRLRSDVTGSAGGDQGDPDGDSTDSGEDVTVQLNAGNNSIEVAPSGGAAQAIANYISGLTLEYYDANGALTNVGSAVRKIGVTITGATTLPNPQTGQIFSIQLRSDVQIASRQ